MFLMRMRKRKNNSGKTPFLTALGPESLRRGGGSLRTSQRTRKGFWLATSAAVFLSAFSALGLVAKEKKIPRVVTGRVLDEAETGIVDAAVTLTNLETGKKIATYTSEGGRYQFSDLKTNHDYEVQASYKGLSSGARKVSSLDNRNTIVLNLRIPPPKD